jgi:hypothetical protein
MDQTQTNRLTMFKTTSAYLDSHQAIWNGMAPLVTQFEAFRNNIVAIDSAAQQQGTPSGAADSKASARDALEDVLFLTCQALSVLGHASNDHDLLALTDLSPSSLDHLGAEELVNRATTVLAQANSRKTELAGLHVTQANLDELTQALQNFSTAKEQPRTETAVRMSQTKSLETLFRDGNGILRNQIDRMINLFRRSHPDFVAGYRGARLIVDRAATRGSTKTPSSTPPPPSP